MRKTKSTKRALLLSVLALLSCVAMLVGSTFAWFTDSVESGRNVIAAGNLDVELLVDGTDKVTADTVLFDNSLWEPGVVVYENLQVANVGSLALKYQMTLNVIAENATSDGYKLSDVVKVAVLPAIEEGATRAEVLAAAKASGNACALADFVITGELLAETKADAQAIVLFWEPGENDNNWNVNNGKTTTDGKPLYIEFGIVLQATQLMHEEDSFGKDYDALANAWDGTADVEWYDEAADEYVIYTAEELAGLAQLVNGGSSFAGKTVKLGADINLDNVNWTAIGNWDSAFEGDFDGQGYSIYNLSIDGAGEGVGLFGVAQNATIQNVTVENAKIVGKEMVAAIIGSPYSGCAISNCHVTGEIDITATYAYAGGIFAYGYVSADNCSVIADGMGSITAKERNAVGGIAAWMLEGNNSITNCRVENLELTGWTNVGGITGFVHYSNVIDGCSVENVVLNKTRADGNPGIALVAGGYSYHANNAITLSNNTINNVTMNGTHKAYDKASNLYGSEYGGVTTANFVLENNVAENIVDNLTLYVVYEPVATESELLAALEAGKNVKLDGDMEVSSTINLNGGILDGNGHTITFTASGSGQVVINPTGGTIKNMTITNPNANMFDDQWAIGSMQMSDTTLTDDLYIENVEISGFQLALDMNADGHSVYVKDSEITNWMQISGAEIVSFEGCHFQADVAGQMTFNQPSSQQAIIFLMGDMSFTDCHFEENVNFYLDTTKYSGEVHFNNSTYGNNGVEDRPIDSFGFIQYWFPATGVYGYAGTFGDTKPAQTHFDWYINGELVWDATAV